MSCARRYMIQCKNPQKCEQTGEEKCFKNFPPRMTSDEFATEQTRLLKDIPKEFHAAMSYLAWEQGHSAGYEEVIGCLSDLVDNLAKPIQEFALSLTK